MRQQHVCVIFVLIIIPLKVCDTEAKSLPDKSEANVAKKASNSSVTSYFRHDVFGPNTYAFGYEIHDQLTGNVQFRDERSYMNGSVEGSFGYVRPDGKVMVTRYLSDKERGYMSHSDTFAPSEEHKWQEHWPTKKPDILTERPAVIPLNVTYNKEHHLNMTEGRLPASLANAVRNQHGVDVNRVDLEEDLVEPIALDIINGKIPLEKQAGKNSVGFEAVNNLIPRDFPIAPFGLPHKLLEHEKEYQHQHHGHDHAMDHHQANKYTKANMNNAEKSMNLLQAHDNVKNTPRPLTEHVDEGLNSQKWYEKIIHNNRKEFLQNLPDLE